MTLNLIYHEVFLLMFFLITMANFIEIFKNSIFIWLCFEKTFATMFKLSFFFLRYYFTGVDLTVLKNTFVWY